MHLLVLQSTFVSMCSQDEYSNPVISLAARTRNRSIGLLMGVLPDELEIIYP